MEFFVVPVELIATPGEPAMPKNLCSATDKISSAILIVTS
jgi:hypothetical protein